MALQSRRSLEPSQIRRAVARTFIPRGQLLLYKVLYEAGEQFVSYKELHQRMGLSAGQLSGVLGALGNRINQTQGLESKRRGIGLLLELRRHDAEWGWSLSPELRAVLESMPRLLAILVGWPVDKISQRYREVWVRDWGAQRRDFGLSG